MLKILALTATLLLHYIKTSVVLDGRDQKGIYVSDYCPSMKHCVEGSHVMCMYYNPNHLMGPKCLKPKNVSITPDLANLILELTNAIRSRIALGKEKGRRGELLPRGYGMFKLKWDSELATFAQVLANQCVLKHDLCRASKKFPDPGQTAGLVRFSVPDWFPISHAYQFTVPGLTARKFAFSIEQSVNSWYKQKIGVTPSMITSYPDWKQLTNDIGRLYLEMIYGTATRMGCGVSAYREYAFYDTNVPLTFNSVQMICNFSARPRRGAPVYTVSPPAGMGFSVRCGCPEGTEEGPDCLCSDNSTDEQSPSEHSCTTGHCKPAVVLLPIFTVENAPPEKLIGRSGTRLDNEDEMEILDLYPDNNSSILHAMNNLHQTTNDYVFADLDDGNHNYVNPTPRNASNLPQKSVRLGYSFPKTEPHSVISSLLSEARHNAETRISAVHSKPLDVQKRVFGKHGQSQLRQNSISTVRANRNYIQARKQSVFAKVAKFKLPKSGEHTVKADVKPRKDFSNVKNLMEDYLNFKKDQTDSQNMFNHKNHPLEHHKDNFYLKTTTERFLNSAEEKVMKYNYYLRNISQVQPIQQRHKVDTEFEISAKEKSKDKLMNLLDMLEQEVKHIELDGSKKEIFDAKIRKIYGEVVGEPKLLTYKTDHERDFIEGELSDFNKYESERKRLDKESINHVKKVEELENNVEKIRDRYSDVESGIRPVSRSQSSLYNDKHLDARNVKKTKDGYESFSHPLSDVEDVKAHLHKEIFDTVNDIKGDVYDKEVLRSRMRYSDSEDGKKVTNLERRKFRDDKDPLGRDRRIYYQSKLENLERKLHNSHNFKHHKDTNNRKLRPVLPPTREEQPLRASKNQPDPFYMPDRARFLHGF